MSKKERKLTLAEQKRNTYFERVCEEMEQRGYQKKDLTVGVWQANIIAIIIMLPFVVAAVGIYRAVNPFGSVEISFHESIVLLIVTLVLIILHESIHGLTWGLFAKSHFKAIHFGIIWKALTPYCNCSEPLTKRQYMIGVAMPTLVLGVGMAAVAILLPSPWILFVSVLMLFSGGGDFFMLLKMLLYRTKKKRTLYYDHPHECGVVVFEKNI